MTVKKQKATPKTGNQAVIDRLIEGYADLSTDLILVLDSDDNILWRNPAMINRTRAQGAVPEEQVLDWIVSQVKQLDVGVSTARNFWMRWRRRESERVIMISDAGGRQDYYQFSSVPVRRGNATFRVITLSDISAIKQREEDLQEGNRKLEHRLNHDRLTGLPNASLLLSKLKRALRLQDFDARVGLLLVELQRFRELNTIHGPDATDLVMSEMCSRIRATIPGDPAVARSGSREFAVMFEEVSDFEALLEIAEKLQKALKITVPLEAGPFAVSVNIAIVVSDPEEADPDQLLMDASVALYHPEIPENERIRPYHPEMRGLIEARSEIYSELNRALENDEIEPFFQPQVNLTDGSLLGFEVLVRWRHPDRGLVPPGVFIGVAEDTGLLPAVDDTVMRKAFATVASWEAAGRPGLRISLNASGFALRDPSYADRVMWELDRHGLAPKSVAIEILESVQISDDDDIALKVLRALKAQGVHLELDDFGTGHASIEKVVRLEVDTVKLDHSIVRGICEEKESLIIVETALVLARRLNIRSLAEGIEDREQLEVLRKLGCDYGQGYGICKPMSADATLAWMAEEQHRNIAVVDPQTTRRAPRTAIRKAS